MERMKKVVSLLLCLVMVVGLLPMSAIAATGTTHYLMFATDRHANTSIIGNIINNMESNIGENKLEYLALGGDMVGSGSSHPTYNSSTVLSEVTGATTSLSASNVDIVAGIHDMNVTDDAGIVLPYQGGGAQIYAGEGYYVYGVEEYCISEDSNESNWSAQAQAFVDWANGDDIDKSAVIFVSSHYPLHVNRNDNDGAYYWHQALNSVATGGDDTVERDIVFFHGHNHTVDGNEYVYNVGDTMSIQNGNSTASETIYYTYATAGYLNQNSKATLVTLTDEQIVLEKYTTSGAGTAMTTVTRTVNSDDSGDDDTVTTNGTIYTKTDSFTAGEEYLITVTSGGITYAVSNTSDYAVGAVEVTVDGDTITTEDTTIVWAYDSSSYLTNNSEYLYLGKVSTSDGSTSSSGTAGAYAISSSRANVYDSSAYTLMGDGNSDYYLTFSSGTFSASTSSGSAATVVLYQKTSEGTSSGGGSTEGGDTGDGEDDTTGGSTETVVGNGTYTTADDGSYQKVTFETTVTGTTTKTVYVLSSGNPSGTVLIANSATAGSVNLVANDGGDLSNTSTTVIYGDCDGDGDSEYYIELDDATNELWTVSGSYTFENQDEYLRCSNGNLSVSGSSTTWSYSSNHLSYTSSSSGSQRPGQGGSSSTTYYLRYNNGWTVTSSSSSASSIYFYVPTEVEVPTTETTKVTYSVTASDIEHFYSADESDTETVTITASVTDGTPTTGTYAYEILSDEKGIIDGTIASDGTITFTGAEGTAQVKVSYTWTDGENTYTIWQVIDVTATSPYYTLDLHKANIAYTEATGLTEFAEGTIYYTQNEDGTYTQVSSDAEFDSSVTYYTLSYTLGDEITAPIAIKGIEEGDRYGVWAVVKYYDGTTEDGTDMGTVGAAIEWSSSDESIATVDKNTGIITFTGKEGTVNITATYLNGNKPSDTVTISVTQSQYSVPSDGTNDFPEYPNEGAIRYDKTATAVGNFSETGIAMVELSMTGVPYTTGSEIDVVLMLDQSTSMGDDRISATVAAAKAFIESIVKNEDGTFNDNRIYVGYFNGNNTVDITDSANIGGDLATVDSQTELDTLFTNITSEFDGSPSSTGTDYAVSLKKCYDRLNTAKTDGTGNNRQQFCVFMSDGVPTEYQVTSNTYLQITGSDNNRDYSQFTSMFTGTNFNTRDSDGYKYEYYSTEMKKAGVTVYTVGLGLNAKNNAWGDTYGTAAICLNVASILLNDISGPAGETTQPDALGTSTLSKKDSYFFSVEDEDAATEMENVFSNIANEILQAATDVTVEDQITDEYTMIFDIPTGDKTITGVTNDFYIEFLKYTLDATTHERVDTDSDGDTYDDATSVTKLYLKNTNGVYSAAKDSSGTAYDAPVFTQSTIGEKGTLYYWTTNSAHADTDVSVTVDGATYYFVSYGMKATDEDYVAGEWYNMTSGGYAYGTVDSTTNMSEDLVIATPYFVYNASTKMLYWTVDKLDTAEYALRYFLYLNNSATEVGTDDETDPGSYLTNDHAYITYTNFKGNDCRQEFPKPQLTWNGAQVSYVFYLVNSAGQPINKSGQVVDFANAVFVTDVYTKAVVWNKGNDGTTGTGDLSADWLANDLLPDEYTIYDEQAHFTLNVYEKADGTTIKNQFTIDGGTAAEISDSLNTRLDLETTASTVSVVTTKVYNTKAGQKITGYDTYDSATLTSIDFSNTTVAFAVVWESKLVEDVVVVDYGLDVVINVVQNDLLQNTISGIGTGNSAYGKTEMNTGVIATSQLGTAALTIDGNTISIENENAVRFHQGDMEFNKPVTFYYESPVKFYEDSNQKTGYMYSSVTVIPATTIYYEDEYVTLKTYEALKNEDGSTQTDTYGNPVFDTVGTDGWDVSSVNASATQQQDRPGVAQISKDLDADNNYGYDAAYAEMSSHSMDNAAMINVNAYKKGEATFTFYGTGFDIISVTSNMTGTLMVQVTGTTASGASYRKNLMVDTYYGYTQDENGEWVTSVNDPNALYQVPVIKLGGLEYGQYTVKLVAAYSEAFAHDSGDNYDLYLDAIRIYDPTGNKNDEANAAYVKDGEGWPIYKELRNLVIEANTFGSYLTVDSEGSSEVQVDGAVFIDSDDSTSVISDYISYGPNNELYLAAGQAVAFSIADVFEQDGVENPAALNPVKVQLAIKTVGTSDAEVEIFNPSISTSTTTEGTTQITTKTFVKGDLIAETISTATDMYYDITALADGVIVISNPGEEGIISITNLKFTFEEAANVKTVTTTNDDGTEETSEASVASISEEGAVYSLRALRSYSVSETTEIETEPTEPEATEPETTEPETETTEPETEVTEPETEATEPETETTEPEPDATEPEPNPEDSNTGKTLIKIIKKLLGWLFG